jgi:uncharacterized protein (TIGR03437 family)
MWGKTFGTIAVISTTLLAALPLCGEVSQVSVRVSAGSADTLFFVDGEPFRGTAVFLWPVTSKHFIGCAPTGDVAVLTNLGVSNNPVTAHPDLKEVSLSCPAQGCKVMVRFFKRGDEPNTPSPGRVCVGTSSGGPAPGEGPLVAGLDATGTCSDEDFDTKCGTVTLAAYPNSGYFFRGWTRVPGNPNQSTAYITTFQTANTVTVSPYFYSARPLQVTIDTSPPGLQILADRAPFTAPRSVEWGWETTHTLGAIPVQRDNEGRLWTFDSWSDGGAINHEFTMPVGVSVLNVTARFVPASTVSFLTDPPLLKLSVDKRENWPNYTFQWAAGTSHSISAPAEQTDASGRKYRFQGWSNGKPASFDYTVESSDVRLTATYRAVGQVAVSSSPAGLRLRIDGADCTTPCSVERELGASVRVSAPASIPVDDSSRLVFQGWADGGSADRSVTAPEVPLRLNAVYQQQNRLIIMVEPADAALCRVSPDAPDRFYARETVVAVELDPAPGQRFKGWDGDASGSRLTAAVDMASPKRIRARFEAVPYIRPSGVRNAVAEAPVTGVAPGSIISIFGANFADQPEAGPPNPLAQSIAGVTVRMRDKVLPLFMVSPEEIRAQVPADTEPGMQRLTVGREGKPDTSVEFEVVRNAPGLFFRDSDGRAIAVAMREGGELLSPGSGARPGETLTLLGTGFGPCYRTPPDGFTLPDVPEFRLADAVELVFGEAVLDPLYAGAGGQSPGVSAARFRVPENATPGADVPVRIRVNGVESNTVVLPVAAAQ